MAGFEINAWSISVVMILLLFFTTVVEDVVDGVVGIFTENPVSKEQLRWIGLAGAVILNYYAYNVWTR